VPSPQGCERGCHPGQHPNGPRRHTIAALPLIIASHLLSRTIQLYYNPGRRNLVLFRARCNLIIAPALLCVFSICAAAMQNLIMQLFLASAVYLLGLCLCDCELMISTCPPLALIFCADSLAHFKAGRIIEK